MSIADIIAIMNNDHLEDVKPPARIYMKPQTRFTATFMGESNMVEGRVCGRVGADIEVETVFGRLQVSGAAEPGTPVHLSIRPEQIKANQENGGQLVALGKIKVEEISFFGTHHRCQGRHVNSNQSLIIRLPQDQPARAGDELAIAVQRNDIVLMNV